MHIGHLIVEVVVLLQHNNKGFTLIEALLVIAIIGVLLLALIPSVMTIINKNKEKSCISTRDSIISAAKMYVAENKYDVINCGNNTITISTLKAYGKISDKTLDSRFPTSITVNYNCTTKKYTYTYNVDCQS